MPGSLMRYHMHDLDPFSAGSRMNPRPLCSGFRRRVCILPDAWPFPSFLARSMSAICQHLQASLVRETHYSRTIAAERGEACVAKTTNFICA